MVLLVVAFLAVACGIPAAPGYQLSEPRTNAIGIGAAAVFQNGAVLVVGGSGDAAAGPADPQTFLYRDTRLFDVLDRSWSLLQPLPMGQQRAFHSLNVMDEDRVLLFGGAGDAGPKDDLWVYSRVTNVWNQVSVAGPRPPARAGHASVTINGALWVSGGAGAGGALLSDTWRWQAGAWTQVSASGGPGPNMGAVAFEGASGQLCVATLETSLFCLAAGATAWTSEPGAPGLRGASVASVASEVALLGGLTAPGGTALSQQTHRWNRATRSWSAVPASEARAWAASGTNTAAGVAWRFGGLAASGMPSGAVLASGPPPQWADTAAGCEAGFADAPACLRPLCARDCWGVGRCIAPDLCECDHGFTGPLCAQQLCSTCGVALLPLNQPVYWPVARDKALRCIARLRQQIGAIQALLPLYPANCGQTYQQDFPFQLQNVSKAAWDFRIGPGAQLAAVTASTLEDLQ